MAALIGMPRAAWRRQPQGPVAVNWGNPLSNGLIDAWCPSNGLNAVSGNSTNNATIVNNITDGVGDGGRAWVGAYQDSNNYISITATNFSYTGPMAFEAVLSVSAFQTSSSPYISGIISQAHSNADISGPSLRFNTDGALGNAAIPCFYVIQGGNYRIANGTGSLSANKVYHIIGSYDGATVQIFVDGNPFGSLSVTGAINTGTGANPLALMSEYVTDIGGFTQKRALNGKLFLARVWRTGISDAKAKELAANPWQLFQPRPARFILIPSSGGGPTTHDVALTLAYIAACAPAANAQFNAGITFSTLAGAMSGKTAQFNSALSLDTNVSLTLARALSTLASLQLDMTAGQSVSALNDAVAAITESITCSYTSSVTANLLASLSFGITQALLTGTGAQLTADLIFALNASTQTGTTAAFAADVSLLTTLQTALQAALSMTASFTLPATLTITIDGERLSDGDVSLALAMQAGMTTSATAILSAQLTLATHLLATPSGVAAFQTALALAHTLSTAFITGSTVSSELSLAVSLALADAASVSLGGSLSLGVVLNNLQAALASLNATTAFPITLTAPITGGLVMEAGVSLGWTLSMTSEGAFFEITVTLPTGRVIVIQASERLIHLTANERLIAVPQHGLITSL